MSLYWSMSRPDTVARAAGARAEAKAANVGDQIRVMQGNIDRLSLLCQAMWELVSEKTNLTGQDIEQRVMEIDLRDGTLDGKMGRSEHKCPQCNRNLHRRHDKCLYCGHEVGREHAFDVG